MGEVCTLSRGCVPALLLAPLIAAALFLPRLVISDGAFYQQAMLALQLNDVSILSELSWVVAPRLFRGTLQ